MTFKHIANLWDSIRDIFGIVYAESQDESQDDEDDD